MGGSPDVLVLTVRLRVSLTTKLLLLITAMMASVAIVIVVFLIEQFNSTLDTQHQQAQNRRYQQLKLADEVLNERLVWWIESIASQHSEDSLDILWQELLAGSRSTEFNYRIEALWLHTGTDIVIQSAETPQTTPTEVSQLITIVQRDPRPHSLISCTSPCHRYVAVPLFREHGELPVLVIRTQVADLLAMLSVAEGGRLVMLPAPESRQLQLPETAELTSNLNSFWQAILTELDVRAIEALWDNQSRLVTLGETIWSVSLLSLPQLSQTPVVLLHADDMTDVLVRYQRYQQRVAVIALCICFLFTALVYLSTRRYRHKLLGLTRRLPLLARHRYDDFKVLTRQQKVTTGWLVDEADVLLEETHRLATELERIDASIAFSNAQLERMAMFDTLTGLPNRNMLTFQIKQKLAEVQRNELLLALFFIDLDDFKKVNDTCGHDQGDELIKAASQRITQVLRESDTAGRFGGDEFVVLLSNLQQPEQVTVVAEKIMTAFDSAITVAGREFYISVSIGAAMATAGQSSVEDLLRHADIAMYEAKQQAGSSLVLFDDAMTKQIVRRVEIESEARIALKEGQFYLALQPQIDLVYRRLIGFEALIRWRHPQHGEMSPGEFLPVLEGTPLMTEIDDFVIDRALSLMQTIASYGYPDLKMAINLSSARYTDAGLPGKLKQKLKDYNLSPTQLALEVTESVLLADTESAIAVMEKLKLLGCSLVIDDFGTGYASFSYLQRLPVDTVKIDRSFVASLENRAQDRSIVTATINMAHEMSLTIIAEGIETEQQYLQLLKLGCDLGQGYWIARPIAETRLREELQGKVLAGIWQLG